MLASAETVRVRTCTGSPLCDEHITATSRSDTGPSIDASETAKIRDALKRRFGRDIELEQTVDPSVLGGAVIDAGEVVIDGSVRGRLHQLEAALTH